MNIFIIVNFYLMIASIYAFNVAHLKPNGTMLIGNQQFEIQIDQNVIRPPFSSRIRIHSAAQNEIHTIDVRVENNAKYDGKTLAFNISNSNEWKINDEYYITFDEGVLFSNSPLNSTAKNESTFWRIKVVTDDKSSTEPTTTTTETSTSGATNTTSSDPPPQTLATGEPSPTRSARLGMGLGITIIGILLIGEILYFKCFYHERHPSENYQS